MSYAGYLRTHQTDAEKSLWHALRNRRLAGFKFRRQHPITPYIVDFVSLEHRLIIELDGGQHAGRQEYDDERTSVLHAQGFRVLRFWNHQVLANREDVLEMILQKLSTPHPNPLPQGERE